MEISQEQYQRVEHLFPAHRGNVRFSNLEILNAILHVSENGCKWRGLPTHFGPWQTIYRRWRRWNIRGVLTGVFRQLREEGVLEVGCRIAVLDSTGVKVHPDGTGAQKNMARKPSASPTAAGTPKYT